MSAYVEPHDMEVRRNLLSSLEHPNKGKAISGIRSATHSATLQSDESHPEFRREGGREDVLDWTKT